MMGEDHVALLGTKGGPAIRPGSSMPTSNFVRLDGKSIVLDCGLGVTRGLCDHGMALPDLSMIFISHMHSDHYIELGPLLHTAWTAGLKTQVEIWAPAGIDSYWEGFVTSMKADIDLRIEDEGRPDLRELVTIHTIDIDATDGIVMQRDGLTVTAIRTEHPPLIETFAFSFKSALRHVVFSGDTAPLPALEGFAENADLLVHEAMLEAALPALMARIGNSTDKLMAHWLRSHTFAHDAAKTASAAGVKRLALSHLIPSDDADYGDAEWKAAVDDHFDGKLIIGEDGIVIPLDET